MPSIRTLAPLAALALATAACNRTAPADSSAMGDPSAFDSPGPTGGLDGIMGSDTPTDPVAFVREVYASNARDGSVLASPDLRNRYLTPELAGMIGNVQHESGGSEAFIGDPLCNCSDATMTTQDLRLDKAGTTHTGNKVASVLATITPNAPALAGAATASPPVHLRFALAHGMDGWKITDIADLDAHTSMHDQLAQNGAGLE